jgi:hypothetical protein
MLDSIDRFVAKALSANVALTLMNHPQVVHGFDNQNDDDRSREIIRAAIEFIRTHLGNENPEVELSSSIANRAGKTDFFLSTLNSQPSTILRYRCSLAR